MNWDRLRLGIKFSQIGLGVFIRSKIDSDLSKRYLLEQLGKLPGLPAKGAQLLALKIGEPDPIDMDPLSLEYVKHKIVQDCPTLAREIDTISDAKNLASLGQVHLARLKDGRELAIKIKYPQIEESLEAQLDLLLAGLKKIASSKLIGLNFQDYASFFRQSFAEELNYTKEASHQADFYLNWQMSPTLVIPKVYPDWSSSDVLVQDYVSGLSLEELPSLTQADKDLIAGTLLQFFSQSLFEKGLIHLDLHSKNWGFNLESKKLVIYDFGSSLRLDKKIVQSLHRLLTLPDPSAMDLLELYQNLGFAPEKIVKIADRLLPLTNIVLEPFRPGWKAQAWNAGKRMEEILGEDKWWFRSAGPTWLLPVMRSFLGVAKACEILTYQVPGSYQSSPYQVPTAKTSATRLRVEIKEHGREIVALELPAAAIENIEDLIPDHVLQELRERQIDLAAIKANVIRSGFSVQEIINAKAANGRQYRVWLE